MLNTGSSLIVFDPDSSNIGRTGAWRQQAEDEAARDADWQEAALADPARPHANASALTLFCAPATGSQHARMARCAAPPQ